MFSSNLILLIAFVIKCSLTVDGCGFFESKKYCDCGFLYSIGFEEPKKLFDLPSIEKCGLNLACGDSTCADECLNKVREILGILRSIYL